MKTELQSRIERLKTTALMEQREKMGPVELVNWWTSFTSKTSGVRKFEDLDAETQSLIRSWESHPFLGIWD